MKTILFLILLLLFTCSSVAGKNHEGLKHVGTMHNVPRKVMRELISSSFVLDYCEGGPNPAHEPGKGKHCN